MIYLASPYSHPDKDIEHRRYLAVSHYASSMFIKEPQVVRISPIQYWHPTAVQHELPTDAMSYREFNHHLLRMCDVMELLAIEGWEDSEGIALERKWAEELGIGVNIVRLQKKM